MKHSDALQSHSHRVGTQYPFKTEKLSNMIQPMLEYYSGTPGINYKYNCSSLEVPFLLSHNTTQILLIERNKKQQRHTRLYLTILYPYQEAQLPTTSQIPQSSQNLQPLL